MTADAAAIALGSPPISGYLAVTSRELLLCSTSFPSSMNASVR